MAKYSPRARTTAKSGSGTRPPGRKSALSTQPRSESNPSHLHPMANGPPQAVWTRLRGYGTLRPGSSCARWRCSRIRIFARRTHPLVVEDGLGQDVTVGGQEVGILLNDPFVDLAILLYSIHPFPSVVAVTRSHDIANPRMGAQIRSL